MKEDSFKLRKMRRDDIPAAMKLSVAEGWNQTEDDWLLLIENSGNVCLLAEKNEKIIGTTTAINYHNDLSWIGMVLVDREYRGRGVATALLTFVFNQLEDCKSIKLDATPAGRQVYQKCGFKDEYEITRMVNMSMTTFTIPQNEMIAEPIRLNQLPEVVALDQLVFGVNRQQLIEFILKRNAGKSWAVKHNKKMTGFALQREGNRYHHVGPVIAETTVAAQILLASSLNCLANRAVVVDVLSDKEDLVKWLISLGFVAQRHFVRMFKEQNYFSGRSDKYYLICGPEVG
jgi:GNAT superfamily N-acetyltransferase